MKRHILIALLAAATLGLSACGDKGNEADKKPTASKTGTAAEKTEKKDVVDTMQEKAKDAIDATKKLVEEEKKDKKD